MKFNMMFMRQPVLWLVLFAAVLAFPLPALAIVVIPLTFLFFTRADVRPVEVENQTPRFLLLREKTSPRAPPF